MSRVKPNDVKDLEWEAFEAFVASQKSDVGDVEEDFRPWLDYFVAGYTAGYNKGSDDGFDDGYYECQVEAGSEWKDLYRAKFNYQGQVYEEFARALSTIEAFHLLLVRLRLTLGRVSSYDLKRYFDGRRANIELWRYSEDGKKQTNVTLEAFEEN